MDDSLWMGWLVVAVFGLLVAVALVALMFRQPLDVTALLAQLGKLLEAGRVDVAIKLCRAGSRTVLGKVGLAILSAQVPLLDEERGATGYRQQGEQRPYALRLRETAAPAIRDARARVRRAMVLAVLGVVPLPALYLMGARLHQQTSTGQLVAGALLAALAFAGLAKGRSNLAAIATTVDTLVAMNEERLERERQHGSST